MRLPPLGIEVLSAGLASVWVHIPLRAPVVCLGAVRGGAIVGGHIRAIPTRVASEASLPEREQCCYAFEPSASGISSTIFHSICDMAVLREPLLTFGEELQQLLLIENHCSTSLFDRLITLIASATFGVHS